MTTLVTGATGFLGLHLVDLLVSEGAEVRALVREGTDAELLVRRGIEVVRGDITAGEDVRRAVSGCERVYHLAGVVSHRRRDEERLRRTNVDGVRTLLAAVGHGTRVVHVSSIAALGPVAHPGERADEERVVSPLAANLVYAATKRAGELAALDAASRGLDVVIANPGFLLGPGDRNRVSTWPVTAYLAGRLRFTTPGGLAFVDARDVAAGLIALASRGRAGERTIFAREEGNLSWDEFFSLVSELAGCHRRTVRLPAAAARSVARLAPWLVSPDEVRAAGHWWFASPRKAERELGFATRPLAETVRDTIADHARAGGLSGAGVRRGAFRSSGS